MKSKSRLKPEIQKKILNCSSTVLGHIADKMGIDTHSLRVAVKREGPKMCLPHVVAILREELALPPNEDIVEIVYEETYLHQ